IKIEQRDDAADPTTAVAQATDLITNVHVVALLGPSSSGPAQSVVSYITSTFPTAPIPEISCCATAPALSAPNFFRTAPSDAFQGRILARLASDASLASVSAIFINSGYGTGLEGQFKSIFGASKVLYEQAYAAGDNFATYATAAMAV